MSDRKRIVLRKGLDLPMPGAPGPFVDEMQETREVGLLGRDAFDLRLALQIAEGDRVRLGQTLFVDRKRPEIRIVSPVSGVVRTARPEARGRSALVVVESGATQERQGFSFDGCDLEAVQGLTRETLVGRLLETGEWISLRERPFDRIPDPDGTPDALLVRLTDSNPLAAPLEPVLAGREDDLRIGISALSRLCEGPTFVSVPPGLDPPIDDLPGVRSWTFSGPHPAGLPGTQIHRLFPIRAGRRVWHVGAQETLAIGRSLRTASLDADRVVSLAGPQVRRPHLIRTRLGADVDELVRGELLPGECRVVSGSPLSGRRASRPENFLGRFHQQVTVLPEVEDDASPAWIVPFAGHGSFVPPWRRKLSWSARRHGTPGAMLPLDVFDAVVPMRLPIALLLRALAAGDLETARRLGALELVEEDLALCSFVCPAKLEYGELLRKALDAYRTEPA